jgi:hypothetical protein
VVRTLATRIAASAAQHPLHPRSHHSWVALGIVATVATAAAHPVRAQTPVPVVRAAQTPPSSAPNPYLAFLPAGAEPHWEYWQRRLGVEAMVRRDGLPVKVASPIVQVETEPPAARGQNDHPGVAEPVDGFGSAPAQVPAATLSGTVLPPSLALPAFGEPDGAIPLAASLTLAQGERVTVPGFIGDGAFGSGGTGSGDFDVVAISGRARQRIDLRVRAMGPGPTLDPAVHVYDASGGGVAFGDDTIRGGFYVSSDVEMTFVLPLDGTYFFAVGGQDHNLFLGLRDPFDPSSGPGVTSEGSYELIVASDLPLYRDADYFGVRLQAGDVVGAVVSGGDVRLSLARGDGELLVSSRSDLTALYPPSSGLPGGGDAAVAYVADRDGTYAVGVAAVDPLADGAYTVQLEVLRPPLAAGGEGVHQVLFLDFDGALVEPWTFGGGPSAPVLLSPLADFLPRWGLGPESEDVVIDEILATVAENLVDDVRLLGANGDYPSSGVPGEFVLELRNSRDHPDPGPGAARVVIGGSIEELGLETIGLAGDIDPGNVDAAGFAVVLLDLLSDPGPSANSLNDVERAPGFAPTTLVGRALGAIAAHEAGHLFGNFHTARDTGPATIMDRGGRLLALLGIGEDEVLGTADDEDVDLEPDTYEPLEGFLGVENTRDVVAFGLPAGGERPRLHVDPLALDFGPVELGATALLGLTLHNAGTEVLEIDDARLLGSPAFFRQPPDPRGTLAPGASRTVDLGFAPSAAGAAAGTLELSTSDPARPSLALPLAGSGGRGVASIDRTGHDFGTLLYGDATTSATTTFTVQNDGSGALSLRSVLVGGTPERFAVDGGAVATIPPGALHSIALSFRPGGAVGDARASLVVETDDAASPRLVVELAGRSEGPDLHVEPGSPYSYGILVLGRQGRRAFRLENRGTHPLVLGVITLEEDAAGRFRITAPPSSSVVPAADRGTVEVVFEPQSTGIFEGLLTVDSSDPDEPRMEVLLVGGAGRPELVVEPERLAFGAGTPGVDINRELTLTILDAFFTLRVDASVLGSTSFSISESRLQIPPESTIGLTVTFTPPDRVISEQAELVLATNDPFAPTSTVPLSAGVLAIPVAGRVALPLLALLLVLAGWWVLRR